MRIGSWTIVIAAFALAGCGQDAPAAPGGQDGPPAIEEELPVMGPERHILAFGDSLFAGYNLEEEQGYPELLQNVLRVRGINARVTDAGISGDTSAAGLQRIGFALDNLEVKPDLALVELGGNDLLRGIPPAETRANLSAIMDELASREIPVMLMGMRAPPNLGARFQQQFDSIYPDLAAKYDAALVPFFLEEVYDKPELIQPDRVHPTAEGIAAIVQATAGPVAAALPDSEG